MKISISGFLHFLKIWAFPIIKIPTLLKNSNQKFVNFTIKVRFWDYLLAKDWYLEFQPCDVCSVTRRSVWLYKNNRISPISDICLYISSKKCPITKVFNHRLIQKGQQIVRTSLNNRLLFNRINLTQSQIVTTRNTRRRHSSWNSWGEIQSKIFRSMLSILLTNSLE